MTEIERFVALCRDETEVVARLVALLEQERQILIAGEVLKLEALADEKNSVLALLAEKGSERQALLAARGIDGSGPVRAWLADKPAACKVWVALEDLLQKALTLNQVNGRYIAQGLQRTEQALSALKAAAGATMAYGPDGSQDGLPLGGRHLGSA